MTIYIVVSAANAGALQTAVNAYLAKGYSTAGGLWINAAGDTFYQAVTA